MRRFLVTAAIGGALVAAATSVASTSPQRIVFGLGGGNIPPFQVTIEPTGRLHGSGAMLPSHRRLSHAKILSLSRLVRQSYAAGLTSRLCAGTLPDWGSHFVRAYGRTVSVRGKCEPRFQRLWNTLAQAVGLRPR